MLVVYLRLRRRSTAAATTIITITTPAMAMYVDDGIPLDGGVGAVEGVGLCGAAETEPTPTYVVASELP